MKPYKFHFNDKVTTKGTFFDGQLIEVRSAKFRPIYKGIWPFCKKVNEERRYECFVPGSGFHVFYENNLVLFSPLVNKKYNGKLDMQE